jgi:hypothetical protein
MNQRCSSSGTDSSVCHRPESAGRSVAVAQAANRFRVAHLADHDTNCLWRWPFLYLLLLMFGPWPRLKLGLCL